MTKLLLAAVFLGACACSDDRRAETGEAQPEKPALSGDVSSKKTAPAAAEDRLRCLPPAGWKVMRDRKKEAVSGIQKLELAGPRADRAPVFMYASFYGPSNPVFAGHEDFIERNSRNILGEKESDTEKFSPVKKAVLAGDEVFAFASEIKEYLNPENESGGSVVIKEKFYVRPVADGFFVLRYYAPASAYGRYLPVFEKFASSCELR